MNSVRVIHHVEQEVDIVIATVLTEIWPA